MQEKLNDIFRKIQEISVNYGCVEYLSAELGVLKDQIEELMDEMQPYIDKLKDYEDAEEQGLLLKLPCKVGTHIYIINHYWIDEGQIIGLAECDDVDCACFKVYEDPDTYSMVAFDEFGKTWFLTEEEAERKLKELQG